MPRKLIGVLQTSGMQGPPGPEGKPGPEGVAGKGFPVGGLANQILAKKSDADYDTEWIDNNAKGNVESVNGKTGQVTLTAEDVGATTEQWVNQQNYLKSIPSEYITETELESKGYLTEHQSLANYSTTEEMNNAISNHHDSTKQDKLTAGNNITIENNVISATGGGEPDAYIKSAAVDGNKLTLTNKDNTTVEFEPTGGSGGGTVSLDFYKAGYKSGSNATIEATGLGSIAFGSLEYNGSIKASQKGSMAFGYTEYAGSVIASSTGALAHGYSDTSSISASGIGSTAEGYCTLGGLEAIGIGSHAEGWNTKAYSNYQHAEGKQNIVDSANVYQKIVGNGTGNSARSNAYTLDWTGNGTFAGTVSSSTGADYAEYFEWKDGNTENEDRVGYIVTLDGDKIVKATSGDDILGICSGTAMVLGDSAEWNWSKRYLTDDFGRIIYEDRIEHHEAIYNPDGELIKEAWEEEVHAPKENPNYDSSKPYERRSDRPEWQIVGMMGKLYVRDNGTCEVNGYATVDNGIAIKSTEKTNMRVMERVTENIVKVLLK